MSVQLRMLQTAEARAHPEDGHSLLPPFDGGAQHPRGERGGAPRGVIRRVVIVRLELPEREAAERILPCPGPEVALRRGLVAEREAENARCEAGIERVQVGPGGLAGQDDAVDVAGGALWEGGVQRGGGIVPGGDAENLIAAAAERQKFERAVGCPSA